MKAFPKDKLIAVDSGMGASLEFNPFSKTAPSLWYSLGIAFGKILPEKDDLSLFLDGIILPERDWQKFSGPYRPQEAWTNGSVYLDSVHNPIDVYSIEFSNRRGNSFDVKAEIFIDFEYEGTSYENVTTTLEFATKFTGINFVIPTWRDPSAVKFPVEWNIPAEYTQESVDELVSRFADLEGYTKTVEGQTFSYAPKF